MASKKYLDKGGLEHAWAKIKSWIQTYLSSWKTTSFGSGTYSNSGSITSSGTVKITSSSLSITKYMISTTDFNMSCYPGSVGGTMVALNIDSYAGMRIYGGSVAGAGDLQIRSSISTNGPAKALIISLKDGSIKTIALSSSFTTVSGTGESGCIVFWA